ncbi:(3S)-malyl-CoA thioesterase [Methylobacterium crusticola]|uniref:(3S)-malyl-CoA thioesterase n=1 Tax=Methylobacterium crusticola TaxID=1697972 RepID=A0ABQ4R2I9_9HYPH|nr:aldolase/citrate lyase family protein [Methylobacterium crusticola]GJD51900.1 (3S)-malyl-CoA thioesterase [Methylobacterium crusticola]
MTDIRPRRSALLVPGADEAALAAARRGAADAVILDLAETLVPEAKEAGRERVLGALRAGEFGPRGGFGPREVVVRINGLDTPWGEADLAAVAKVAPDAVLVPRVEEPEDLAGIGSRLRRLGAPERTRIWAALETPLAILSAEAIASAVRDVDARLACLVVGAGALAREARMRPGRVDRAPLLPWLATALAAARAHDLDLLLDPPDRADPGGVAAACAQARDLGFDGAVVATPAQAGTADAAFAPDPEALAAARALLAAGDAPQNRGRAAFAHAGRTVLRRQADEARRLVALAEAIARRDGGAA